MRKERISEACSRGWRSDPYAQPMCRQGTGRPGKPTMAQHQGDVDYDGADGDGGDEVRENA